MLNTFSVLFHSSSASITPISASGRLAMMAMVFGMLPLALAFNDGGEIQAPMGRAIIGGVITSTILTLVVVPVLYSYLVRERRSAGSALAAAPPLAGDGPLPMPADRD